MELLRAKHVKHSFPRHTHERYAVGVIEQGALGFTYRGEHVVASSGDINLCVPDEAHTGQPAVAEGWAYRMFYLDADHFQRVAADLSDRQGELPFFQSGVVRDASLARQIRQLHIRLESADASLLEQETRLLQLLAALVSRHADASPPGRTRRREPQAITKLKRYLERHYAEPVSLDALSQHAQLSRYHLVRAFREVVGVSPHAYLRQVRVDRAKELLAAGHPIAEVALMTGFTDQSHLTRWLKRLWGVTPGQYRNSVQDS